MTKGRFHVPWALPVLLALNGKMIAFHRPEIVGLVNWSWLIFAKSSHWHWHCGYSTICPLCELLDIMLPINHFLSTKGYQAGKLGPKASKISKFSRFTFYLIFPVNTASLLSPSFPIPASLDLGPLPLWLILNLTDAEYQSEMQSILWFYTCPGERAKRGIAIFFTGIHEWKGEFTVAPSAMLLSSASQ